MAFIDQGSLGWLLFFLIVVGLPVIANSCVRIAKILAQRPAASNADLLARFAALEKKCEKLQEQVNEAHILIHDEQRELDRKLAARLEATSQIPADPISQSRRTAPAEIKIS